MEAGCLGQLFVGGLTREATEETLKAVFERHGPVSEVLLKKDGSMKCRGFGFITFENPADAELAASEWNGKFVDGKTMKVEQAKEPFFQSGGRQGTLRFSRKRRPTGEQRSASGSRGQTRRRHPSRGERLDGGESTRDLNVSSFRGTFPVESRPSSASGGPHPKRSAPFTVARSNSGMGGRGSPSRGRGNYRGPSHGMSVSSWRRDRMSPKHGGYATKNRSNPSFRDTKEYASIRRHRAYRDHARSRQDKGPTRGYSGHDGYGRHGGRDHFERPGSSPNGASYQTYSPPSRGREFYGGGPSRGMSVSSWRRDRVSGKDDGYATKTRNNPSFRDTMEYASMSRHNAYRDHAPSRQDKGSTRGYSDHDGHGRHGGRDHFERRSSSSNRASYQIHRTSRGAAPAQGPRKTYGGSSFPDDNNARDRYGRSREKYSRSHGDFSSTDAEHCGRKEPTCPPSVERMNRASPEAHGSSRDGTPKGEDGGRRSEKGD
ncbi:RNA-binding motif protein, Y chromosome, family 1 member B-like [Callithrix jacchus]